jgi:hypothetical protein
MLGLFEQHARARELRPACRSSQHVDRPTRAAPRKRRRRNVVVPVAVSERFQDPTWVDRSLKPSEDASIRQADSHPDAHAIASSDRRIMISSIGAARLRPAAPKRRGGTITWLLASRHCA